MTSDTTQPLLALVYPPLAVEITVFFQVFGRGTGSWGWGGNHHSASGGVLDPLLAVTSLTPAPILIAVGSWPPQDSRS